MNRIPKAAIFAGMFALGHCWTMNTVTAQEKKTAPKESATSKSNAGEGKKMKDGFTMLPSGLEYKIIKHGTGKRKPIVSDHIEINIIVHQDDSVIFSSRKMNDNKCVPLPVTAPRYKGDLTEGIMIMVAGDSAVFRLPVDSLKKIGAQPWMKDGKKVEYDVVLVSVRTDDEEKKYQAELASKQKGIDDKILQDYFTKNNLKPMKTASGLYYTISKEGAGDHPKDGQTCDVNYTGMFLDGKKFDSNVDTSFHHVQTFSVEVGKGHVIKGWDEGLLLLKKGSKAVFYIPSGLAYGPQERNPIHANSILVFEVEMVDFHDPMNQSATDDKLLKDYFAKNNIKATKTASGLYYRILHEGTGDNPKPGQKLTMRYLGKTLDGHVFDGNMDENFKSTKADFSFTLGVGQVIKGWDEGVQLLKKGARGTLYLPSGLAYGERGAGGAIPPNAVLIFDVEVVNAE